MPSRGPHNSLERLTKIVAELIKKFTEAKGQSPMPVKKQEITRTYGTIVWHISCFLILMKSPSDGLWIV